MISLKLDLLLSISLQTNSTSPVKEAMTDVLKFIYNMIYHYPKVYYICCCTAVTCLYVAQIAQKNPPSRAAVEDKNKVLGDLWSPKLDGWGNDSFCPIAANIHVFLSVTATSLLAFYQSYSDYLCPSHLLHQTPSRLHWLTFYMFLSGYPFLLLSKLSGSLHRRQNATRRLAQFLRLPMMTSIRIILLCFRRLPVD